MGIIIDIVIVAFILLSIYLGYKKGLVSLGVQVFAFIIALIITFILYRPIANFIVNNTTIDEKLQEIIQTKVGDFVVEDQSSKITNSLIESAKNGMLPEASRTLAINIIYGITLLALFIISRIALVLISALANIIAKLPIIDQFNKIGGILYGLLRGVLITYAILMIINLVITFNPNIQLKDRMDETYLAKAMSTYNLLNVLFLNKI